MSGERQGLGRLFGFVTNDQFEQHGIVNHGVKVGPAVYVAVRVKGHPWWSGNRWLFLGRVTVSAGPLEGIEAGFADARPARVRWLRREFPALALSLDPTEGEADR